MDDFSWGQTRVVLGESGKKLIVHDEGKFDPKAIPLKSWSDYVSEHEQSCCFNRLTRCVGKRALGQGIQPQHWLLGTSEEGSWLR